MAADDERPPPTGIVLVRVISKPWGALPPSAMTEAMPRTSDAVVLRSSVRGERLSSATSIVG